MTNRSEGKHWKKLLDYPDELEEPDDRKKCRSKSDVNVVQVKMPQRRCGRHSWNCSREKALRVLGVSENDVELSLKVFLPRRLLYGAHFPGTRNTVIMQALRVLFPAERGIRAIIMAYDVAPMQKRVAVSGKALRLLGTKRYAFGRHKALRILGETNHEVEEANARDLARLGHCGTLYEVDSYSRCTDFCAMLSGQIPDFCGSW
eukprot:CAMPEP_0167796062 /NCGR_PEP_ID=MMETSP0111_2-20121227/14827_1 /TAXON_ID=91324 /ORGANISM="Lotharella globosa, Strain CCCM811" /LENGTH=203 /DNA_ID=CAMNT_0007689889 /DNA_START=210 /DNA_END=818 /DNA_ORIENTATION=-